MATLFIKNQLNVIYSLLFDWDVFHLLFSDLLYYYRYND